MNRKFHKINPKKWKDKRFRNLSSDFVRYVYLYLFLSIHQTSAGACHLPPEYACADLNCTLQEYEQALIEIIESGLIAYDMEAQEVYIFGWFEHNPPTNPKHELSINSSLECLISERIYNLAKNELESQEWYKRRNKINEGPKPELPCF